MTVEELENSLGPIHDINILNVFERSEITLGVEIDNAFLKKYQLNRLPYLVDISISRDNKFQLYFRITDTWKSI